MDFGGPVAEESDQSAEESPFAYDILVNYGWYILIAIGTIFYFKPKLESVLFSRSSQPSVKETSTTDQMRQAREKLQEKYNEEAKLYAEKVKEQQHIKLEKKLEAESKVEEPKVAVCGQAPLNVNRNKTSKPRLRPADYNPLMGGNVGGWRPARKGPSAGG